MCVLAGFDLRSRLGSSKGDGKDTGKPTRDQEQKRVGKNGRLQSTTTQDEAVKLKSDKELKLDARIERIRLMNEGIMKRQEEIEKEKQLYN